MLVNQHYKVFWHSFLLKFVIQNGNWGFKWEHFIIIQYFIKNLHTAIRIKFMIKNNQ